MLSFSATTRAHRGKLAWRTQANTRHRWMKYKKKRKVQPTPTFGVYLLENLDFRTIEVVSTLSRPAQCPTYVEVQVKLYDLVVFHLLDV